MINIKFKLSKFDGPLDLLLHLIGNAQIDICDIFISEITEQYIEFLKNAEDLDMEGASEFIEMAAYLLEIKSKAVLPQQQKAKDEEISDEELLVFRLQEYKKYKNLSLELKTIESDAMKSISKLPEDYPDMKQEFEINGLTIISLMSAITNIKNRRENKKTQTEGLNQNISQEMFTISESINSILQFLKRGTTSFKKLIGNTNCKEKAVTYFVAMLELLKNGKIIAEQQSIFENITIKKKG